MKTIKLAILGNDTLAAATIECCKQHHDIVPVSEAELVWICFDTPIENDIPNPEWVMDQIDNHINDIDLGALILVSSQMPVGTTARLEKTYPTNSFAHSPENIRVTSAVADFSKQSRIVVGIRGDYFSELLTNLLSPFTDNIIFTDPETAEMCKHTLNTWLGMNIAFINEIAKICSLVGADVNVITQALKTERRISPAAPLKAGGPYGGGHLARDIHILSDLSRVNHLITPIISSIKTSNDNAL